MPRQAKKKSAAFTKAARPGAPRAAAPRHSFAERLAQPFPKKKTPFTAAEIKGVLAILAGLQLPPPENDSEFMAGTEGGIIFINRYGVVIRVEEKDPAKDISSSTWVMDPLARFETGNAVVEICPAAAFESDKKNLAAVKKGLAAEGLRLWDSGLRQLGRIPLSTPEFPAGKPVVIDRQAVRKLSDDVTPVKDALQEQFYGPLKRAIAAAHDGQNFDPQKVRAFWALCEDFVRDGKLVAGWNDYQPLYDNGWEYANGGTPKGLQAAAKAKAYEARLSAAPQKKPAAPRPKA